MSKMKLAREIIQHLSDTIGCRPTGSAANQEAFHYVQSCFGEASPSLARLSVMPFDALDWTPLELSLSINQVDIPARMNPYAPSYNVTGKGYHYSSMEALQTHDSLHSILILSGELTTESIMPTHYTFYNPDHHKALVALLNRLKPSLVIAVKDDSLPDSVTGAMGKMDFQPVFCDGDLPFPTLNVLKKDLSVFDFLNHEKHEKHEPIQIHSKGRSLLETRSSGNVVASIGPKNAPKIILTAHYDTFFETPGALDNASGIAFLTLALQELSAQVNSGYELSHEIIFVAINGEDHYAYPGEKVLLESLADSDSTAPVTCAINIDGLGFKDTKVGLSHYEYPDELIQKLQSTITNKDSVEMMLPWPQGDHMIFALAGIPAIAITSSPLDTYFVECHHTRFDTSDTVDYQRIIDGVDWFMDFIRTI